MKYKNLRGVRDALLAGEEVPNVCAIVKASNAWNVERRETRKIIRELRESSGMEKRHLDVLEQLLLSKDE